MNQAISSGAREIVVGPMRLWHSTAKWRRPRCRFLPSCSEYGIEAVRKTGVVRGLYLATRRVMRCNPWGGAGFDPVPIGTGSHPVPEDLVSGRVS